MSQDILFYVMKFEGTAGDSEPEICREGNRELSANYKFCIVNVSLTQQKTLIRNLISDGKILHTFIYRAL